MPKRTALNLSDRDRTGGAYMLIIATVIVLLAFLPTRAASLDDYKQRVNNALSASDDLFESLSDTDEAYERETIATIEKLLPVTEKVEWPGGSVETDNRWLRAKLTEFTTVADAAKRGAILTEISERLLAVSTAVDEIENAAAADRSKDEDKRLLAEILRREEYQKPRAAEESLFQKWLREFLEWLERTFPRSPVVPSTPQGTGSLQFGLQILIYALVIALIGFLIYKFAPFFSQQLRTRSKREKNDRVILGERVAADDSAADLFSEAERLAREGNLRSAIRKGYVALLCELSDRNIVRLERHKTNRDYLRDVRKNENLFENMTGLTRSFELNWYGLRTAEQGDWDDFRERYQRVIATGSQNRER